MSEVGPTGLCEENEWREVFSQNYFPDWKIPISVPRVVQSGGGVQIKEHCFRSGIGS